MTTLLLPPLTFLTSQIEVKKSKFISNLFTSPTMSQDIIKTSIQKLQINHPKARHFVYATRYFNNNSQIVESFSDDGEPKNSSGIPSLNVLRGESIVQVGVITIRYFGGTKLGIGGLVRAYGSSCKEVLQNAREQNILIAYKKKEKYTFSIDYKHLSLIKHQLNKYSICIVSQVFLNDVELVVEGESENINLFLNFLKENI